MRGSPFSASRPRIGMVVLATILCANLALSESAHAAGQYLEMRFERSEYRAMGGVDITLDPSTPANGALGGGLKMRILSIDVYSTVSDGMKAYSLGYDVWDATQPGNMDTEAGKKNLKRQFDDFADRIRGDEFFLSMQMRIDFLNFMINKGPWTVQFGAYAEVMTGADLQIPSTFRLRKDADGDTFLDIGHNQYLLRAGGRGDAGFALGVGYAFPFADDNFQWSVGARFRGFYRYSLPEHAASAQAHIYGEKDISYPEHLTRQQGWGLGIDLYTTLHFSADLTGFRLGAYVEDIATYVLRGDKNFLVPPRVGIGAAWISPNGKFTVGTDIERVESFKPTWQPTWQVGLSYRLGNEKWALTPKAGFILNQRNIVTAKVSPAITTGLVFHLGFMQLVGMVEYHTARQALDAGLSISFGI